MVTLRPHYFQVLTLVSGGLDENGDPTEAQEVWGDPIECRCVDDGKRNVVRLPNGEVTVYPYAVFFDDPETDYLKNTVRLLDGEMNVMYEGVVKGNPRGRQLNAVMYL